MLHSGHLTPAQVAQFHADGYLVIPSFFDPSALLSSARHLISQVDLTDHPLTKFTTGGESGSTDPSAAHVGDRYFLESGSFIRYFFEEGALDDAGNLTCPKERAINKCGHALHVLHPEFRQFSFADNVKNVARSIAVHKDPRMLQSMVICKQPSIGGAVPCHNDSTFLYTDPPSAVGFWFALEDCTRSNGCLSFLPGSHRWPKGQTPPPARHPRPLDPQADELGQARGINKRFVRSVPGDPDRGTSFETLETNEEAAWNKEDAKVEECPAGTLVLIHGSVLHKSEKNLSDKSRYIYTFHMIEGEAEYDEKNWLQPTEAMPFPSLYEA
ncbi:hypothetical protein ACQY0O_005845 [Thecaphora frezii]